MSESLAQMDPAAVHENGFRPSMLLACSLGHLEMTWNPQSDAKVREMIQKKMDQKVRFFILKPILFDRVYMPRRVRSTFQIEDRKVQVSDKDAKVMFGDKDIEALVASGDIELFRSPSVPELEAVRIANSVAEVISNRTVGVPSFRGG